MKKYSITSKFMLLLSLAAALSVSFGCSKKEMADAKDDGQAEMKTSDMQSAPAPIEGSVAEQNMPAPVQKAGELSPLSPEIVQMIESKRTETVEVQIYSLTNSLDLSATQKAQALFSILPSFNRDGQRSVAHAAVRYVGDSVYSLVSVPLLEGKLDPQILSVFMTDTLNRPDSIKMSVLNSLAMINGHPMQNEAKDLIAAFSKPHTAAAHDHDSMASQQMVNKE
jgi:hypothetical protein